MSIYETLIRHEDRQQAISDAFAFIFDANRDETGRFRLIDAKSGQHVLNFTANGVKYRIATAQEGVGLKRMQNLRVRLSMVGFDCTIMDQFAVLTRIEKHFNKAEYVKAAAGIVDMMNAITKANRAFPYAAEACALFILKEGENMAELPTEAEMEQKIEDWNKEGIHEQDFFFLCLRWAQDWNAALADFSLTLGTR